MCQVAEKIKFCTCLENEAGSLKDYWALHRFNGSLENRLLGTPMLPTSIPGSIDLLNRKRLLCRVNEPDAFDCDLHPQEMDRLELHFSCPDQSGTGYIAYGFEYRGGRWVEHEYDFFDWKIKHEEEAWGGLDAAAR